MKSQALVTCTLKLLLVDLLTGAVEVVEDHRGPYYGVSWPRDGSALCLGHGGQDNTHVVTLKDYVNTEKGWISLGERRSTAFLSAPHGILCVDERIVACNTGRNCLAVLRMDDMFYQQHWYSDARWDRLSGEDTPGFHLNSIFRQGDRLYVVAHNHSRPSEVLVLSWPGMELIERLATGASWAHNVWIGKGREGERMYVCDSMHGRIMEARSQALLWQAEGPFVILRGVAGDGRRLWVGGSANASRAGRKTSDAAIFVLDVERWELLETIDLPACGAVHEIRLIGAGDLCHHGYPLLAAVRGDAAATARHEESIVESRRPAGVVCGWNVRFGDARIAGTDDVTLLDPVLTVATFDGVSVQDVRVEGTLAVPGGEGTQHLGLVARYLGPGDANMVVGLAYWAGEGVGLDIWRQAGGEWVKLGSARVARSAEALPVALVAQGRELSMLVEGQPALQVQDDKAVWPGVPGVRGTSGRVTGWSALTLSKGALSA